MMNENDFYLRWCEVAADQEPSDMARLGGAIATSPGQIFVAGYQAAIRVTFPELQHSGWVCFAVTEDRKTDSPLPGVTLKDGNVSGFKTWIAAADSVDALVLKVGSGEAAAYGYVSAEDAGVVITLRTSGFLADMSQGAAQLSNAAFTPLTDASRVHDFRHCEPLYIYQAFLAYLSALDTGLGRRAADALNELNGDPDLVRLDQTVSELLTMMDQAGVTLGDHWDIDRRLFTMYSKGIQGA
ncbi:MAG: hypothetical protein ACJAXW_001633 [Candidatus Azotimanducaceae bacterium]|jgi:hypothetical protein